MEALRNPPTSNPQNNPRRSDIRKCRFCRERKVKCEPVDRNSSNQERCTPCQRLGLDCGPKVPCPPRPRLASAPTYAAVLSSPSPGEKATAPMSGIRRDGVASRPPIARHSAGPILGATTTGSTSPPSSSHKTTTADSLNNRPGFVISKLQTLGNLREVFQKLDYDRRAIGPESFLPTRSHSEGCKCAHCSAFSCTLNRIIQTFALTSSELYETLDRIDLCDAENTLLRVSRNIEAFFEVTRSYISRDDGKLGEIKKVYYNVSRRLVTISIERGEHAEVGRLRQILAKHDPEAASQLADSLSDTSMRMRSTLDMLKLPSETQKVLKVGAANEPYPPLHIALNYRIALSAHQLQCMSLQNLLAKDPLDRNAVHVAAASLHTEFLRGVVLTRELLEGRDIFGNIPLMVAVYHGDYSSFQILWDTGVGRDFRDAQSRSIMAIACFVGSREIVEFLLLRGVSQHDRDKVVRYGTLHTVAARNHVNLCKYLLEHDGTQGQFTPHERDQAIQVARENHHTEILELLHGSATHTRNEFQRFPDGTQPGQPSEIKRRQISSVLGYPRIPQPQCPPPPAVASASVPTPVYPSIDEMPLSLLQDDWPETMELNTDLLGSSSWDPSTSDSNRNFM